MIILVLAVISICGLGSLTVKRQMYIENIRIYLSETINRERVKGKKFSCDELTIMSKLGENRKLYEAYHIRSVISVSCSSEAAVVRILTDWNEVQQYKYLPSQNFVVYVPE